MFNKQNRKFIVIGGISLILIISLFLQSFVFNTDTDTTENIENISDTHFVLGNDNAPVTIEIITDYQCAECAYFNKNVLKQIRSYYVHPGLVKIYIRDYMYYGPESMQAAIAARCAGDQNSFWRYHDALYAAQGPPNEHWAVKENLITIAGYLDLDVVDFDNCLMSDKYPAAIAYDYELAISKGVTEVPTFIISGGPYDKTERIEGVVPFPVFQEIIESMLSYN